MARGKLDLSEGKKKKQNKVKNKNLKCFHYHKEWHFKRDYPYGRYKLKDQKNQSKYVAVAKEEGNESANVLIAFYVKQEGKQVLGFGCSFYICPFKIHLTEYQEFDGGKVMVENNAMCKITDIVNVKLKMHDGSMFKLKQVRHIPDLKRKLISIGMVD